MTLDSHGAFNKEVSNAINFSEYVIIASIFNNKKPYGRYYGTYKAKCRNVIAYIVIPLRFKNSNITEIQFIKWKELAGSVKYCCVVMFEHLENNSWYCYTRT